MTYNKISEPSTLVCILSKAANKVRSRYRKWSQRLRYLGMYPRFDKIGEEVILDENIYINKPENIQIGDGTFIGANVVLNAIDQIIFGEDCGIAAGSYFMTWNHVIDNRTVELRTTGKKSKPIRVGDGAWVGYNAVVLPGVTIGTGSVVGAGAVVTEDVPDWTVVAGVPSEPIMKRTPDGLKTIDES